MQDFNNGKWVTQVYVLTKDEVIQLLIEQNWKRRPLVDQLIKGVPVTQIKF